ncbi:DUF2868 domain-containing protein [Alteromonas sediminis]|uniref:DUF2868 domain-containing protein n=1 Tax=Alteromonas sediminis TaxID=2259342 RepID=A0A3N5Y5A2_9ALTE|nr:DUF2868 domain-containing protein [Alteromonas sediminis]RPJ68423.1 DUF2868 domain-containing protein [Alteromonas sediminis]
MQFIRADKVLRTSKSIVLSGFCIGLFLSVGVLSGDPQGRVNLLYLLAIFMLIPALGAGLSALSLLSASGLNLARLLLLIPLWTPSQKQFLHTLRQHQLDKYWCFVQSQMAGLAYAFATLLAFLVLLLFTDMHFVWRSTLLSAEQLHPVLVAIATPWWFWEAAQPSYALLQATQDSRLAADYADAHAYAQWWPFVFAILIVYSFSLRVILWGVGRWCLSRQLRQINREQQFVSDERDLTQTHDTLSEIHENSVEILPTDYWLANWGRFDQSGIATLSLQPKSVIQVNAHTQPEDLPAECRTMKQLLLVKAWEPPLGELADYMNQFKGWVLPVDSKQGRLCPPKHAHLQEWQRFVYEQQGWALYQPTSWSRYPTTKKEG